MLFIRMWIFSSNSYF